MSSMIIKVGQIWQQREGSLTVQRRILRVVNEAGKSYVIYNRRFVGGDWWPLEFRKELLHFAAVLSVGGAERVLQ